MQKYATRGHDDIEREGALARMPLQASARQSCDLAAYVAFRNISGGITEGRVHNGRMKGKSTGSRVKRAVLTPEDESLFREAMGGVTPLDSRRRDRVNIPPPPPSPTRVVELPPEVKLTVDGDSMRFAARSAGVSHAQIADLRAGKVRAEASIDLHGEKVEPALVQLRKFLIESRQLGRRCVLVVHGKGTHSDHGAPLREAVLQNLLGPLSGIVHAFASAAPTDGGEGATYVMLRGAR
jgi:DNA-nicking Smr family endonuclease